LNQEVRKLAVQGGAVWLDHKFVGAFCRGALGVPVGIFR
jgi:hypothetical protein